MEEANGQASSCWVPADGRSQRQNRPEEKRHKKFQGRGWYNKMPRSPHLPQLPRDPPYPLSGGPCLFCDKEIPSSATTLLSFPSLPELLGPWVPSSPPACSLGISVPSHWRESPLRSTFNTHLVVIFICISQRHLTSSHYRNLGPLLRILLFSEQSPNLSGHIERKCHTFVTTIPQAHIWSTCLS